MTVTLPPFASPDLVRIVEAVVAEIQPFLLERRGGQITMHVGPDGDVKMVISRYRDVRGSRKATRAKQ